MTDNPGTGGSHIHELRVIEMIDMLTRHMNEMRNLLLRYANEDMEAHKDKLN